MLPEYERDLFVADIVNLPPDDNGKRNLIDIAEFASLWGRKLPDAVLEGRYPELINHCIDRSKSIDMYRRFAAEAMNVFSRYPAVMGIL